MEFGFQMVRTTQKQNKIASLDHFIFKEFFVHNTLG